MAIPQSSNIFFDNMKSLGSLIPSNPHRNIQHMAIMNFKVSTIKVPFTQSIPLDSVKDITIEPHDLWYK